MAGTPWLTLADFAGLVGGEFSLRLPDGGALVLTLHDVTAGGREGGPGPDGARREQFSLVFAGPAEPLLEQGIRELSNAALGDLALFLVPIGLDADGARYEAAFA
ncbi:MAG TPA: hypothetical protein VNS55_05575 [Nocardioides sp.]|nr:hypothetical protein [Nocardioides sp.]